MTRLFVCAVKDRALDAFMTPFFVSAVGQAERMLKDEARREDSQLGRHPEDFDLYLLGTFFDDTGRMESFDVPQLILRAQDMSEPFRGKTPSASPN